MAFLFASPLSVAFQSGLFAHPRKVAAMTTKHIYSKASDVTAKQGVVNVDGPDAVDVGLTPDAALETSERLLEGAMTARGQEYFAKQRKGKAKTSPPNS